MQSGRSLRQIAQDLVDAEEATVPEPLYAEPLALAWALKELCFEAWSTAPARAVRCAQLLDQLQRRGGPAEVGAVASWVQGIADLCQGRMVQAVDRLDAAQQAFERLGRPAHAAQTRVPQVVALSLLGRHDDAMQCGRSALAQFIALGDELAAGKVELNLGTLAHRQDRHGDAVPLFRSAAVRGARARDRQLSIQADIALANALTGLFDFDEALRINHRARMRAETHGLAVLAALAQGAIGRIELARGRHHLALQALAAASRGLAQAGASPQQCIDAEAALAEAYGAVNLLPEAAAVVEQVIQRAGDLQLPLELARARLRLGRVLARLGQHARAATELGAARTLFEAQGNRACVALSELALAELLLDSGAPGPALAAAQRAAEGMAASGVPGWQLQADAVAAAATAALGQVQAAQAQYHQVLVQADALQLRGVGLACHIGLGELAASCGQPAAARQHLGTALAMIDRRRMALPDDSFRAAQGAQAERVHDRLVALALDEAMPPAEVLALLEQGRARALALSLHRESAAAPADDALATQRMRLQWARNRLRLAQAEGDTGPMAALSREVAALEDALLEAHRREALAQPSCADDAPAGPALSVPALQAALPPGSAMVVYQCLGERLLALVVDARAVHLRVLDARGLEARLEGLRFQIDGPRLAGGRLQAHAAQLQARARSHLQALHGLVWAGIAPLLADAQHVVVVPHRSLHYIPFAALHDGTQWLARRHELVLAPSATLWLASRARQPQAAPQRVLAVGHGGSVLPQVRREVQAVAAAFGAGGQVIEGDAATSQALRRALPGQHVLHLACHGQFRADSPSFSALELADGPLTLLDAQQLPVQGLLVALSACETGLSRIAPGDELLGLVRGFLLAGARMVLASQWQVDDAATADLMGDFYRLLAQGVPAAAALRSAQLALADAGRHPVHWAGFVLHGAG